FRTKWPSATMYEINDAGAPLSHTGGLIGITTNHWGAWHIVHHCDPDGMCTNTVVANSCPVAPGTPWSPSLTVSYNATHYTNVRKALTDDYTDATMNTFANLLGCSGSTCMTEPSITLSDMFAVISPAANFKAYYHTGTCHGERDNDGNGAGHCDYDNAN